MPESDETLPAPALPDVPTPGRRRRTRTQSPVATQTAVTAAAAVTTTTTTRGTSDFETGRQFGDLSARTGNLESWKIQTDQRLDRIDQRFDAVDNRFDEIAGHLTTQDQDHAETRGLVRQILDTKAADAARRERWTGVIITAALGTFVTYVTTQGLAAIDAPHALQSGGPLGVVVATALVALLVLRR